MQDREALSDATVKQIANVITTIVRSNRFSEGVLAGYFKEDALLALAERAETLLAAEC